MNSMIEKSAMKQIVRVNAWVDPSRRKKAKLDVGEKGNIIQRGARVSGDTNSALAVVEPL